MNPRQFQEASQLPVIDEAILGQIPPEYAGATISTDHPGVHGRTRPDAAAVIMAGSGEVVTYRQLDQGSTRLARCLREAGLGRGAQLAILLNNHPRFFEVAWAAQRSGLYYTVINPRLSVDEVRHIVRDSGASALVTSNDLADLGLAAAAALPDGGPRLMLDGTAAGFESYEARVDGLSADPLPDESEGFDMLYTGGTTGRPKGVRRSLPEGEMGQPVGVSVLAQLLMGFDSSTIYLSPAPLYHAAPLRFSMAAHRVGGTAVVMERFDAEQALAAIEKYRVTHSQWVPTMFIRLLRLPDHVRSRYDLTTHVFTVHAAAPCPAPIKEQMIAWWGPILHEYCGGTEGNGLVYCDSEEWLAHRGTVGRPVQGVLHICDDEGIELPVGETGLVYYGETPPFEYHHDAAKTAQAFNPTGNGWTTIGDIGYVDEDGYLYLVDRRWFTIVTGGVNVYPQEVENLLATHPKVFDVAVFGVPNEDLGEEVKAVVQPMDAGSAGPDLVRELIDHCRANLAHVKCPRSIDFRAELPRHPTGKLLKRLLRDEYWAGRATRIGN